jgi:hypothetical protein
MHTDLIKISSHLWELDFSEHPIQCLCPVIVIDPFDSDILFDLADSQRVAGLTISNRR